MTDIFISSSHVLQKVNVLNVQVARVAYGPAFWHDQEMAWGNRVSVLESHNRIILVDDVRWLFFPYDPGENVLLDHRI